MKFTTINSLISITQDDVLEKINNGETKIDLTIYPYIEEESCSRHISLLISRNSSNDQDCDIYLDLDIYQCQLLAHKLHLLVHNRKVFLKSKMNEK
jgi:hypothetical protein